MEIEEHAMILAEFVNMQNEHVLRTPRVAVFQTPMEMLGIGVYENKLSRNVAAAATPWQLNGQLSTLAANTIRCRTSSQP